MASEIRRARHLDPYQYITGDLDEDDALFLDEGAEVDFRNKILPQIEDRTQAGEVKSIEELYDANAYIIDLMLKGGERVFGFRKIPEKWDSTVRNRLFSAIWQNLELKEADEQEIFRLSRTIDSFHYQGWNFILDKKNFETGLNFRLGMTRHAEELVKQLQASNAIANPHTLLKGHENNLRRLRSLAQIMKNPRFKDPKWITRVKELNTKHGWKLQFQGDAILVNDENLHLIIMLLRDRRALTLIFGEMIDADVAHVVAASAS
ncbi:MAG: DUF4868 domain-containing protein [Verrucomicrobiota bacterium]|nr:DUF4868 domain-containing protein [Verrucomicrobiota bacterium]